MSFMENLEKLAKPVVKANSGAGHRDPIEGMRRKFLVRADEQIKAIKAAAEKDRWFTKEADESYVIAMRNGNKALPLKGNTHFSVPNAGAAVKFLDAAKKAVQAGEFDAAFKETAFTRKPKEQPTAPSAPTEANKQ